MSVEIRGLEDVLLSLAEIADTSNVEATLKTACALVARSAIQNAPKGTTGDLGRSIASKVENFEGIVYTPLEYAPYIEYGTGLFAENGGRQDVPWRYQDDKGEWHTTSGMSPRPYMRPALMENRERILKMFREGIIND